MWVARSNRACARPRSREESIDVLPDALQVTFHSDCDRPAEYASEYGDRLRRVRLHRRLRHRVGPVQQTRLLIAASGDQVTVMGFEPAFSVLDLDRAVDHYKRLGFTTDYHDET